MCNDNNQKEMIYLSPKYHFSRPFTPSFRHLNWSFFKLVHLPLINPNFPIPGSWRVYPKILRSNSIYHLCLFQNFISLIFKVFKYDLLFYSIFCVCFNQNMFGFVQCSQIFSQLSLPSFGNKSFSF